MELVRWNVRETDDGIAVAIVATRSDVTISDTTNVVQVPVTDTVHESMLEFDSRNGFGGLSVEYDYLPSQRESFLGPSLEASFEFRYLVVLASGSIEVSPSSMVLGKMALLPAVGAHVGSRHSLMLYLGPLAAAWAHTATDDMHPAEHNLSLGLAAGFRVRFGDHFAKAWSVTLSALSNGPAAINTTMSWAW